MKKATIVLLSCLVPALAACSSSPRKFDVTILDSDTVLCDAVVINPAFEASNLTQTAHDEEDAWRASRSAQPSLAEGCTLHQTVVDGQVRAWFDLQNYFSEPGAVTLPFSPAEVYVGEEHDDYVDVTLSVGLDPTPPTTGDDDQGMSSDTCGTIEITRAELLATEYSSEIEGRIERTFTVLVPLGLTPCDAAVKCTRQIQVTGQEE